MALTSPRGVEMLTYVPKLYGTSRIIQELLNAIGGEFDLLATAVDEWRDQQFVRRATWALDRWEAFVSLPTNLTLTDAERRDRIVAQLRRKGTATKALIRLVAESYTFGAVEVYDINDNPAAALPDYTVAIEFVDIRGTPSNLADLELVLRAVVPAHLAMELRFNWLTFDELDTFNWTFDQIDGTAVGGPTGAPLTFDQLEVYA